MSKNSVGRALVGAVAMVAVILILSGCGGSSDHSSEYSSAQTQELKNALAEKAPEFTSQGIDCLVNGIESEVSVSAAEANNSSTEAKVEGIAKKCAESSSNVQGVLSQACQEEGILGDKCIEEVTNQALNNAGVGEEPYGEEEYGEEPYGEEEYEENPGLEELNQELCQEYEEEGHSAPNCP